VKRIRRLEIIVETERRLTLRKPGPAHAVRCEQCSGVLVLAEEAVAVTGLSSRALHRMVETGEVHFAETPAGALLVCPDSFRAAQATSRQNPSPFCSSRKQVKGDQT
jgi:hypothetical protein